MDLHVTKQDSYQKQQTMPEKKIRERGNLSIIGDAIHAETVRKELKLFRLHTEYQLSQRSITHFVLDNKPTAKSVDAQGFAETEVAKLFAKPANVKHGDADSSVTTSYLPSHAGVRTDGTLCRWSA